MAVNILGIVSVVAFYVAILVIGIIAGRKTSKSTSNEAVLVADRSLGIFVSIFTITATMVGGGYLNGSAESTARNGLVQTQAPFGYCFSLIIAAFTFGPKMRREGYITMFDPFQFKYGRKVGSLLFLPQMMGDLFWSAATLSALGATLSIILDMDPTLAIIISSSVAVVYTFFGGLYSVAYTDVVQLIIAGVGLVIAFPFSLVDPAVDLSTVSDTWLGSVPTNRIASYIDTSLLCLMGGIPWQSLFQRLLACKSVHVVKVSCAIASVFSLSLAIPPIIMGVAGTAADWNATAYDGPLPIPDNRISFILPLSLTYLTPVPVGILGMGAIAGAVMSSADSCILSTSSVFTKNIYADILRPQSSEKELLWVLRICILVVGVLGTLIAIFSTTIYGLYLLCSDLMYVILFPQLTLVLWMRKSNSYGCVSGFFVSIILRLLAGEPVIYLPATLRYPNFDEQTKTQLFPHRTFAMLIGTLVIVVVSLATDAVFTKEIIPRRFDILKCYQRRSANRRYSKRDLRRQSEADKEQSIAMHEKQEVDPPLM